PEPFLLTKPNPKKVPVESDTIPVQIKAKPVPKAVYTGTGEAEALSKARQENREKAQKLYETAQKDQFAVIKRASKSSKSPSLKDPSANPQPEIPTFKVKPVPASVTEAAKVPVKLTTAAILREEALLKRRKRVEERNIEEITTALQTRDFFLLETEAKLRDEERKRVELERKRLQIQLAHEEAYAAKNEIAKVNRSVAQELREESETRKAAAEETRLKQEEENRKKIIEVQEIQENAQRARKSVVDQNMRTAAELAAEKRALLEQAQQELEEERARKAELIKQIRAFERSVPAVGTFIKPVDLTETSGLRILGEMSIIELQERLAFMRIRHQAYEEEKREQIINEKRLRQAQIEDKLEEIQRERENRRSSRRSNRDEGRTTTANSAKTAAQDEQIKILQAKLQLKKA
ncbi:hypothetical protein HK102_008796, partial [Quaeritorhiza haematococci]